MELTTKGAMEAVRSYLEVVAKTQPTITLDVTGGLTYYIPTLSFDYHFTDFQGDPAVILRVHATPNNDRKGTVYIFKEDPDVEDGYILFLVFRHSGDYTDSGIKQECDGRGIFSTKELARGMITS